MLERRARRVPPLVAFAIVACGSSKPAPRVVPEGHGWFCFAPHDREEAGAFHFDLRSSCTRTRAECGAARDQTLAGRPDVVLDACRPASVAHCFRFGSELRDEKEEHFFCTDTASDCEAERVVHRLDVWTAKTCAEAE